MTVQADDPVAEEAARWFLRLNEAGADPRQQKEFAAWMEHSARHREEYAQFQRLWGALEQVKPRRKKRRQTMAALLILGLAALTGVQQRYVDEAVQLTQTGEHAERILADGSVIHLDGSTRVRIEHTLLQRRLVLEQGQVFVEVASGLRPFVVVAGDGETRDIGTRFNVRRDDDRVTVSVAEGRVEVRLTSTAATREIGRGEQLSYRFGQLSPARRLAADSPEAWTSGRWQFDDADLAEVVAQINRQHARPVRIDDPRLAAYRISGVFSATDRAGLLAALTRLYPLRLVERDDHTEIAAR
jgi:transmembrane sensor